MVSFARNWTISSRDNLRLTTTHNMQVKSSIYGLTILSQPQLIRKHADLDDDQVPRDCCHNETEKIEISKNINWLVNLRLEYSTNKIFKTNIKTCGTFSTNVPDFMYKFTKKWRRLCSDRHLILFQNSIYLNIGIRHMLLSQPTFILPPSK